MLIFYSISLLAIVLAFIAERKDNIIWLILSALLLAVICGFRAESVGTDTQTYMKIFQTIKDGGLYFDYDIGFNYVVKALLFFTGDISYSFTVLSFISICLIFLTLWYYRKRGSLTFMVFLFICFFYPLCFNIVRQMLALSIIFAGTILLEKNKNVFFIILLLFTATIHISSIISLLLFFIFYLRSMKHRLYAYISLLIVLSVCIYSYDSLVMIFNTRFSYMYDEYKEDIGYDIIAQAVLLIFLLLNNVSYFKKNKENQKFTIIYAVGLILAFITANAGEASRIALYFTIYELLFCGVVIRNLRTKTIGYLGFVFLALFNYIFRITVSGWYGISPYSMISL